MKAAKAFILIVLFFVIIIPTSMISTREDYGKLIREHKKAGKEYGDDYEVILAISTVNTTNNLTDDYPVTESISYLRKLYRRKYRLIPYEATEKNADGSTSVVTKIKEVLIGETTYQGEELIQFSCKKLGLVKAKLLEDRTYKSLLKFEYIFPDEEEAEDIVIKYSLERLGKEDILYDDDGLQKWFEFLADEGVESIYNEYDNQSAIERGGKLPRIGFDPSPVDTPFDPSRSNIIEFASQFIGRPYQWGAVVGKTGSFDCSSFTCHVYKQVYGIKLPRVSYNQYISAPKKVRKQELRTGDLVFFDTGQGNTFNPITHVGIYIGDGRFINANLSGVKIESLNSGYWKDTYVGAARYGD